ncbi:hypothetical protein [Magnetococcus sp. PR-3]|uniref:hypothetical protein n=1 Tax=Magnetococcus sp. PR-3 TaxID=3120355 RepID=UPI002FCE0E5B
MQTYQQISTVRVRLKDNQHRQGRAVALWGDYVLVTLDGHNELPRPYDPVLVSGLDGQPWHASPGRQMSQAWRRPV